MIEISKIISLIAVIVSIGVVVYLYSIKNTFSNTNEFTSRLLLTIGILAMSLTLVSISWKYGHFNHDLQLILTSGVSISYIFACISVACRKNNLAFYGIAAAVIFSITHIIFI